MLTQLIHNGKQFFLYYLNALHTCFQFSPFWANGKIVLPSFLEVECCAKPALVRCEQEGCASLVGRSSSEWLEALLWSFPSVCDWGSFVEMKLQSRVPDWPEIAQLLGNTLGRCVKPLRFGVVHCSNTEPVMSKCLCSKVLTSSVFKVPNKHHVNDKKVNISFHCFQYS